MAPTKPKQSRKRAPRKAEWDRISESFHQLYIRQKLPLSKVATILKHEHNFEAGISMYKTRIKQVGTKKNFRKEELAAVAELLETFVQAGLRTPIAVVDGRPVPTHRVKRRFSSLLSHNKSRDSTTATLFPETTSLRGLESSQSRDHEAEAGRRRRGVTMPKIILKQSEDMHELEMAMIQINNYYAWRLRQSDEYFLQQGADSSLSTLHHFFNAVNYLRYGLDNGPLRPSQNWMYIRHRASIMLQQQHPRLPDTLLLDYAKSYRTHVQPLIRGVYSYLLSQARSVLRDRHPISMILKVLQSHETQQRSTSLLLKMICDVVRREEGCHSELAFELEYDRAKALDVHGDFMTSMTCWHSLLQRSVDAWGEKAECSRRILYRIGYVHFEHGLDCQAKKAWLDVLRLDDAYVQGSNDIGSSSVSATRGLGWICETAQDFSGAEEWYLKAYNASCHILPPKDAFTLLILQELDRMRARLREGEELSEIDDAGNEDVLEELQHEISLLHLQHEESENLKSHAEPWNEWDDDVPGAKDNNTSQSRESLEEAVSPIDKTLGGDDHRSDQVEFTDSNCSTSCVPGLIWDDTNDLGSSTKYEYSAHAQPLQTLLPCGPFEAFGEDGMGLMPTSWIDACGLDNEALPAFLPEEPTLPSSLPASGKYSHTALTYIGTLPTINDDPEFQEFDTARNSRVGFENTHPMMLDSDYQRFACTGRSTGDNRNVDPMELEREYQESDIVRDTCDDIAIGPTTYDPNGDFVNTFDLSFLDDVDLQACQAIQGQELHEEQDFLVW
ncbi:hypothetical protein AYL99_07294 [Fonsecaea erecta]|uniref:Clr5 domain-containing protein n=1 Tax=Fonsecaea erecta TaxID=1367422 RepID=A0A178ZEJ6_9EURO|nr:hypothetical protein AYL99_07294 [Fonsecaea erecta]OAP58204.1 hypothetical protein AYL99_07294 [Fonsecaea erecta]